MIDRSSAMGKPLVGEILQTSNDSFAAYWKVGRVDAKCSALVWKQQKVG